MTATVQYNNPPLIQEGDAAFEVKQNNGNMALQYAEEQGWSIFPIHSIREGRCTCGNAVCASPGKHPRNQGGLTGATRDTTTIRAWWNTWPDANIGVATGTKSNVVALNIQANAGEEGLRALTIGCGAFPVGAKINTGGGGSLQLFAIGEDKVTSRASFAPGLGLLGEGAYFLAPPSVHAGGLHYTWDNNRAPQDAPKLPEWLLNLPKSSPDSSGAILEGGRNNALASLAGSMRQRGMSEKAIEAGLLVHNEEACHPPLEREEVTRIAHSISRYEPEFNALPIYEGPNHQIIGKLGEETAVQVWTLPEPPVRKYVLEGLIPEGAVTILFGEGGLKKSYIALYIATLACLGQPFGELNINKHCCLYLDAELDQAEFTRRAYSVARGLGLSKPPNQLNYYRLKGPLNGEIIQKQVQRVVSDCGATFLVLDSLTISTGSADNMSSADVTQALQYLTSLGTVLAIDHVAKPQPNAEGTTTSSQTPFGSVFKTNLARSTIRVKSDGPQRVILAQNKHNFGPNSAPLSLGMEFTKSMVRYTSSQVGSLTNTNTTNESSNYRRVQNFLIASGGESIQLQKICDALNDIPRNTIQNQLTYLKDRGDAINPRRGYWASPKPPTAGESPVVPVPIL